MSAIYETTNVRFFLGDCRDVLPRLSGPIAAGITDPPYPGIRKEYGRWSEKVWHPLMQFVVAESKRLVGTSGSAVFVLQNNAEQTGRMRLWLPEFLCWAGRYWGIVQDCYWFNPVTLPSGGCRAGLLRSSVKHLVWLGNPDCYRDQSAVLLPPSESLLTDGRINSTKLVSTPSGHTMRHGRCIQGVIARGGVTPFNLMTCANTRNPARHPAVTPLALAEFWVRYISRPGDTILDAFAGSATVGVAALKHGRKYIGIEREEAYFYAAVRRLKEME